MLASKWYTARRLQTQLLLWTTLILIVAVVGTMEIRVRLNVRLLEENLRDRSETTIRSLNQVLERFQSGSLSGPALEQELRERVAADRTLIRLDVVQRRLADTVMVATSSGMPDPVTRKFGTGPTTDIGIVAGRRAMITSQAVADGEYGIASVASMENIDRYASFNRSGIPAFAAVLILIVITPIHFMYRRIVSKRFDELLNGIERARTGKTARIPESRQDEIGVIAKTLNGLIVQVQSFNEELRRQVANATEDLNQRNLALEEATRQMVEMQKQLLESERMAAVGHLAATFAHEIGSPMTSLSAHVQLLLEDPAVSEDQRRETLNIVLEQIQATVQIVNEMLKSARRGPSDFVLTDVNEIVRHVLRLVGPKLMSQKIDVSTELDRIPMVRGYPLYLQEVFLNIINNASDAMPDGGRLEVKSWFDRNGEFVNIRITDTGPGIDPQVLEKIFRHFVTTKAIGRGTGLGLGIVKEIVDSHRGTFQVESAEGRGTAAHLRFPVEATALLAS